jgi:hypothetical protein
LFQFISIIHATENKQRLNRNDFPPENKLGNFMLNVIESHAISEKGKIEKKGRNIH